VSKDSTGDQAVFKAHHEKSGENIKMSFGLLKKIRDDLSDKKSTVDERLDRAFEVRRETQKEKTEIAGMVILLKQFVQILNPGKNTLNISNTPRAK
jgi:hypothetical protein